MPLYEYQCDACGVRFEHKQPIIAEPLKTCPECGGRVHRLIHPVGIIFKGKGFYVTDTRSKSSTGIPRAPKEKSAKSEGTAKKSDSKSKAKND